MFYLTSVRPTDPDRHITHGPHVLSIYFIPRQTLPLSLSSSSRVLSLSRLSTRTVTINIIAPFAFRGLAFGGDLPEIQWHPPHPHGQQTSDMTSQRYERFFFEGVASDVMHLNCTARAARAAFYALGPNVITINYDRVR